MTSWPKRLALAGLSIVLLIALSASLASLARAVPQDAAAETTDTGYGECVVYYVQGVDKEAKLAKKATAMPQGWTVIAGTGFDSARKRGHGVLLCR